MNIVYAAEKSSIAKLLGEHLKLNIAPAELSVDENPDQTGSFYVGWQFSRYVLTPDGRLESTSFAAG